MAFKKELVETEPEKVTATEDDSGTDSAEEYGDASEGMNTPTSLEFRIPREGAEKDVNRQHDEGETLLGAKVTDSNEPNRGRHSLVSSGSD